MIDTKDLKQTIDLLSLAQQMTALRKTSSANGGEWSGACPFCGGTDRFSVQPQPGAPAEPRWLCRGCTDGKWRDAINLVQRRDNTSFLGACQALFGGVVAIAPADMERIRAERQQAEAEQHAAEIEQQAHARATLQASGIWREYHANLDRLNLRPLWHQRGLSDYFIDLYQVGYCPSFPFGEQRYPTLTIPTWQGGQVVGLAHRCLAEDPPGGRYRPERAGLGKALFFGDPERRAIGGADVLLLEGEIKTMVTFAMIYAEMPKAASELYNTELVGIAGTAFKQDWLDELSLAKSVSICLDPDATEKAAEIGRLLGRERCRVVELPDKIDDLINMGALDRRTLERYIANARKM